MEPWFDPRKNKANIAAHGIGFERVAEFEWDAAITTRDIRHDYGEDRFISYGTLAGRLYVLVWTPRGGNVRPISLRKANARERAFYEKETS
jgi:uncharacterized DUF497 family protein